MTAGDGWVETAYAKINIALHIRRKRPDGYHDLESLFAFATGGDVLRAEPSDTLSLTISGPFGEGLSNGADNLVLRAADALRKSSGVSAGAALSLQKNLPVASGIGGGSADAAAALRLLAYLWSIESNSPQLSVIAAKLGSDIPACLASQTIFGDARGDVLTAANIPMLSATPLLLVNPGVSLSTAAVFSHWDGVDHGALDRRQPLSGRNDLTAAAIALVPQIGEVIGLLERQQGVTLARMSGSGATCFALFGSMAARDMAAAYVAQAMPSAWCFVSELR
jgi:4-diphosphocytidyl-2-C-methyl-D-erythritol kinase